MIQTNSSKQADVKLKIKQEEPITKIIYLKVDIKSERLLRLIYLLAEGIAQLSYDVMVKLSLELRNVSLLWSNCL
jgi:hypothetical protein